MTDQRQESLVHIDANAFIYAVEGGDALAGSIKALFERLRELTAVTSELTLAEVLPRAPLPRHRRSYFDLLVWSGIFDLRPVSRGILVEITEE